MARIPKLEDARKLARESMAKAAAGENPVAERKSHREKSRLLPSGPSPSATSSACEEAHKPTTWKELQRQLDVDVFPSGQIAKWPRSRATMLPTCWTDQRRGSPVQANRTLARLKTLFAWAVREEIIENDPTARVEKVVKERARDRVLSDCEIALFWSACDQLEYPFGDFGKLLLLTAQRRDEVAGMRWEELDLANRVWKIPRERAKNDRAHIVHLNDLAMEIIGRYRRRR